MSVLNPLRTNPSGSTSVTVVLHPADLGDVRATVTVDGDQTTVRLLPSTPAGADALRAALPDLQSGLGGTGQRATVLLGDPGGNGAAGGGAQQGGGSAQQGGAGHSGTGLPSALAAASATASSSSTAAAAVNRLLDVRL